MSARTDLSGYSSDNRLLLAVEVKSKRGASPEWAMQFRGNLLSHSFLPDTPYFLMATPDVFFLWKNAASAAPDALPDYTLDAKEALGSLIDRASLSLETISKQGLEFLIATWLQDLILSDLSTETAPPRLRWLFESGLYDALKNGLVLLGEAA